jgi:chromosome partitioning protein
MPIKICLFAKKGGVGKTTLSLNLAGYLASKNHRVLVMDADPQASLSQGLLGPEVVERLPASHTLSALFNPAIEPDPRNIIHETPCKNIWIAPASDLLQPHSHPDPTKRGALQFVFREFIAEVARNVDYVVIDAPPDCSNLLSWNCLTAANFLVSPVSMETFSAQSVAGVIRKIEEVHVGGNPNLQSLGYVVNLRNKRASLHIANEKKFRMLYGPQVFKTVIFETIATPEAQHAKTHIFDYSPTSDAGKSFASFGEELLARTQAYAIGRAA